MIIMANKNNDVNIVILLKKFILVFLIVDLFKSESRILEMFKFQE